MEFRQTKTADRTQNLDQFTAFDRDEKIVRQRLDALLAINAETAREKALFHSDAEKLEADLMQNPLSLEKTFSYFGLLLGLFPPSAMFLKFALEGRVEGWVFGIMLIVNLISATVGFFSGKVVAKGIRAVEQLSWSKMLLALPFLGLLWGIVSGAAGGIIVFIFGAVFGGILGGIVGSVALPLFTIFHRLMKKGENIELKHFLPIAFGATFVICGFILGL